eukprot:TRINITY_DN1066_c0_g1_i3.p1 TRINITY_DN1066_c0_g1~~TRINITY_DN1066_c0_g1_i3.p1  ORF type:complete len:1104 (+),score=300.04 TRINITY_DN1066_c0_g1_i3:49-3360(+)
MADALRIAIVAAVWSLPRPARADRVLVVSFDGFAAQYLMDGAALADLPHLAQLIADGGYAAQGMRPPCVTKTFPTHYTLATGLYEETHGIVANRFYDPALGKVFSMSASVGTSEWFKGDPVWNTLQQYGGVAAVHFWPGSEAYVNGGRPKILVPYNGSVSFEERVARVHTWAAEEDGAALMMMYFNQPDHAGHHYGPGSAEVKAALKSVDNVLGSLRAGLPADVNLVVLADHGMAKVTASVDLADALPQVPWDEYTVIPNNPVVNIYEPRAERRDALYEALRKYAEAQSPRQFTVYKRADIPERWHLKHSARVGDLFVMAEEGVVITVGEDAGWASSIHGNHGYDNALSSMHALFVAAGPAFRPGTTLPTFDSVHVYALLCKLLNVPPAASNGTADTFAPILKRSGRRARWAPRDGATGEFDLIWSPATDGITITPPCGAGFTAGVLFDVAVTVPLSLPGVDPKGSVQVSVVDVADPDGQSAAIASMCPGGTNSVAHLQRGYVQHVWRGCALTKGVEVRVASSRRRSTAAYSVKTKPGGGAKNVVLVIGDGMSLPMITATRLLTRGRLPVDDYDYNGLAFTKALDSIVTDSAAAASALNTGHKTFNGGLGVYPDVAKDSDSTGVPESTDNPRVETFAEYVRRTKGMKVGVVTTASMVDATPAGVWAHCDDRERGNTIALQALDLQPEVMLGGGAKILGPSPSDSWRSEGHAEDPCIADAFTAAGYTSVTTAAALANATASEKLLGLFAPKHLHTANDRRADPSNTQPSLPAMATAALDVLHRGPDDHFYLMVEAASIDKQAHSCDSARMLGDSLELQETLVVLEEELARRGILDETLIVVTSDHATGGYDVYGTVDTDVARGGDVNEGIKMYGTAEWPDWVAKDFRVENWDTAQWTFAGVNNNHPDYKEDFRAKHWLKEGWIGREEDRGALSGIALADNVGRTLHEEAHDTAVHTTSDVMVFAKGPGARLFNGGYENTEVFHNMIAALGVRPPSPDEDEFAELLKEINEKKAAVAAMAAELAERHATNVDAADACGSGEKSLQGLAVVALLLAATSVISNCCRKLQLRGHTRLDGEAAWPSPTAREMDMEVLDDDLVSDADEA